MKLVESGASAYANAHKHILAMHSPAKVIPDWLPSSLQIMDISPGIYDVTV